MSSIFVTNVTLPPTERPRLNRFSPAERPLPFAERIQHIVLALQACGWQARGVTAQFRYAGHDERRLGVISRIVEDDPGGAAIALDYTEGYLSRFSVSGPQYRLTVYLKESYLILEEYTGTDWPGDRSRFLEFYPFQPPKSKHYRGTVGQQMLVHMGDDSDSSRPRVHDTRETATVLAQLEGRLRNLETLIMRTPKVNMPVDVFGSKLQELPPGLLPELHLPIPHYEAMAMQRRWQGKVNSEDRHVLINPNGYGYVRGLGYCSNDLYFGYNWDTPVPLEAELPELSEPYRSPDTPSSEYVAHLRLRWVTGLWVVEKGIGDRAVPLPEYEPGSFDHPQLLINRLIDPDEVLDIDDNTP